MSAVLVALRLLLFYAVGSAVGVVLSDLGIVQPGTTFGGCGARLGPTDVLDLWLEESIDSIDAAQKAIAIYNDLTPDGQRVRDAMFTFFGIPSAPAQSPKALVKNVNSAYEIVGS